MAQDEPQLGEGLGDGVPRRAATNGFNLAPDCPSSPTSPPSGGLTKLPAYFLWPRDKGAQEAPSAEAHGVQAR